MGQRYQGDADPAALGGVIAWYFIERFPKRNSLPVLGWQAVFIQVFAMLSPGDAQVNQRAEGCPNDPGISAAATKVCKKFIQTQNEDVWPYGANGDVS